MNFSLKNKSPYKMVRTFTYQLDMLLQYINIHNFIHSNLYSLGIHRY